MRGAVRGRSLREGRAAAAEHQACGERRDRRLEGHGCLLGFSELRPRPNPKQPAANVRSAIHNIKFNIENIHPPFTGDVFWPFLVYQELLFRLSHDFRDLIARNSTHLRTAEVSKRKRPRIAPGPLAISAVSGVGLGRVELDH
jgi:hypothetical protein